MDNNSTNDARIEQVKPTLVNCKELRVVKKSEHCDLTNEEDYTNGKETNGITISDTLI